MQQHSCALLLNGGVRCWGSNVFGQVMPFVLCFESMMRLRNVTLCFTLLDLSQIGDNSRSQQFTPVNVFGLSSGVASISLGAVRPMFGLLVILYALLLIVVYVLLLFVLS